MYPKVTKNNKKVLFLSSSYVNMAKLFAQNNIEYDVFLVLDRKFPFYIEDEELDNFYVFTFEKRKLFEKFKESYFDNLGIYVNQFEPDFIICNNYTKLLTKSFLDFLSFTNPNIIILNIHHGDLRIKDDKGNMVFAGLKSDIKEFLEEAMIISTIHLIQDENIDTGKALVYSHETTLKELKQKGYISSKECILNYRLRNVIISYHERTKVLNLLKKVILNLKF